MKIIKFSSLFNSWWFWFPFFWAAVLKKCLLSTLSFGHFFLIHKLKFTGKQNHLKYDGPNCSKCRKFWTVFWSQDIKQNPMVQFWNSGLKNSGYLVAIISQLHSCEDGAWAPSEWISVEDGSYSVPSECSTCFGEFPFSGETYSIFLRRIISSCINFKPSYTILIAWQDYPPCVGTMRNCITHVSYFQRDVDEVRICLSCKLCCHQNDFVRIVTSRKECAKKKKSTHQ